MTSAAVLDIPATCPDGPVRPPPRAGAVVLLVDQSVAAIAAAAWAARIAREASSSVLVIVLLPKGSSRADAAAVLARVLPTLERSGRPHVTHACVTADGMTASWRSARTAQRVLRRVPGDAAALVCPGGTTGAVDGLHRWLADARSVDLLVVPDLTSLPDAAAHGGAAEGARVRPTPHERGRTEAGDSLSQYEAAPEV